MQALLALRACTARIPLVRHLFVTVHAEELAVVLIAVGQALLLLILWVAQVPRHR